MPESIVVLRRFIAIANLFAFVLPASAAPPLPEEFGGVFWGSMPALVPGPEGYIPGRYIHESGRGRDPDAQTAACRCRRCPKCSAASRSLRRNRTRCSAFSMHRRPRCARRPRRPATCTTN